MASAVADDGAEGCAAETGCLLPASSLRALSPEMDDESLSLIYGDGDKK